MNLFRSLFLIFVIFLVCLDASNIREGRITGGREAEPHSNPYVVSLQSRFLWLRYRICTGSILSKRWILSAGHCVMDSWARWLPMDAIIGAHNLGYIRTSQIYPLSHRIAHPMYRGGVGPYDIAMMRTSRDIEFSRDVQPIRLPTLPPKDETTRDNNLLITGWGALQSSYFVTVLPNKLQEARVSYLPYYECYRAVDKLKEYYESNPLRRIHNLCTGPITGGIAGCTGDSGGPLVQYVSMIPSPTEPSPSTTNKEESTTMSSSPMSPTPMTTDRTTTSSTMFPISMTTEKTTTSFSSSSPTPISTDRTSTSQSSMSPFPMTTDRTTTGSTEFPTPMSTDRTSTMFSSSVNMTTVSIDQTTINIVPVDRITAEAHARDIEDVFDKTQVNGFEDRALRVDMMPTVIGVISWGVVPCGKRGAPTVYSNVTNYLDFINKYLKSTYYEY